MAGFLNNPDLLRLLAKFGLARTSDGNLIPPPLNISAKTANYTIKANDLNGTVFTNRGAAGAVTFTLPDPTAVPVGQFYYFLGVDDQNIVVQTATTDTLLVINDVAADSLAMSTAGQKIGGLMMVFCDGTQWVAVGVAVGVTFTVAT